MGGDMCNLGLQVCFSTCMCENVYIHARVRFPVVLCVCVCFASPAVPLSKFKLSCGNISLALQSTCVTW